MVISLSHGATDSAMSIGKECIGVDLPLRQKDINPGEGGILVHIPKWAYNSTRLTGKQALFQSKLTPPGATTEGPEFLGISHP
jgi:hypothetical protein